MALTPALCSPAAHPRQLQAARARNDTAQRQPQRQYRNLVPPLPPSLPRAAPAGKLLRRCSCAATAAGDGAAAGETVGVVIVDHGSRKAESNDMLFEFAELYR